MIYCCSFNLRSHIKTQCVFFCSSFPTENFKGTICLSETVPQRNIIQSSFRCYYHSHICFQRFMKLKLPVRVTLYFEGRLALQYSHTQPGHCCFLHAQRWRHKSLWIIFLLDSILLVFKSFSPRCFISSHKFVTSQHVSR